MKKIIKNKNLKQKLRIMPFRDLIKRNGKYDKELILKNF